MHTAREVLRLALHCGKKRLDIAISCSIDPKTVGKYLKQASQAGLTYETVKELSDTDLESILKNKRGR